MQPICTESLSKNYRGKRGRRIEALTGLDLTVNVGEVLGFLGPNGAGKSTTIKCLMGLIVPSSGTATLFGKQVSTPEARLRVGYLPENPAFYDFLSAQEYLNLVGRLYGMSMSDIRTKSTSVLERLDLVSAGNRPIRGYSKGMVQRLGLAQALLHDPDLYILDEPMSGLDPLGRTLVKQIMVDLKQRGKTIFFSTHVTADVEAVCDRVAVIVSGKLQAMNIVKDVLEEGVEGYVLQLTGCPEDLLAGLESSEKPFSIREVYVPRKELNRFLSRVTVSGAEILLMEPRRRNLEQFFLDIVQREAG